GQSRLLRLQRRIRRPRRRNLSRQHRYPRPQHPNCSQWPRHRTRLRTRLRVELDALARFQLQPVFQYLPHSTDGAMMAAGARTILVRSIDFVKAAFPSHRWPVSTYRVLAAVLILTSFLAHLAYIASAHSLDLAPDEAHYWLWSQNLDASYYSKGPL